MASSDGTSRTLLTHEDYGTPQTSLRLSLTGRDFTTLLMKFFIEQWYTFTPTAEHVIIRDDKEKLCCNSLDFESMPNSARQFPTQRRPVELEGGNIITVDREHR